MTEQEADPQLISVRSRRVIAIGFTGLVLTAVPGSLIAFANPWRYVYLMPFGRSWVVAITLFAAPVLLSIAAWLVLRRVVAWAVTAAATVLALAICCYGYQFVLMAPLYGFEPNEPSRIVAVSPSGSFELVVLHYSAPVTTSYEIVRVRSRAGFRSREAAQDLACFVIPFDPVGPEDTFDTARFLSDHEVEVRTEAGAPWTTTFDPHTLLAASTLSRGCRGRERAVAVQQRRTTGAIRCVVGPVRA